MKYLPTSGALIGALAIFAPIAVAQGQDTAAQSDTSLSQQAADNRATGDSTQLATPADSSSEVQNPMGYRGMERPVNVFPPDSGREQARTPGQVEDKVTGTYDDSTWNDTTGVNQNPAGYRGMERPAGLDSAAAAGEAVTQQKAQKKADKSKKANKSKKATSEKTGARKDSKAGQAGTDSLQQDSTKWGRQVDRDPEVQNPPGYRGMERPANLPDSANARNTDPGAVEDRVTGTFDDTTWQDTTGTAQNPAGYRGMGRAPADTAANAESTGTPADSQLVEKPNSR